MITTNGMQPECYLIWLAGEGPDNIFSRKDEQDEVGLRAGNAISVNERRVPRRHRRDDDDSAGRQY